jgi:hypothetical protein
MGCQLRLDLDSTYVASDRATGERILTSSNMEALPVATTTLLKTTMARPPITMIVPISGLGVELLLVFACSPPTETMAPKTMTDKPAPAIVQCR